MIAIKVNGEYLDLKRDTSINLKLNNPIFGDGNIIPGSYSLPFDIPITDKNAKILGHADLIEVGDCIDKVEAALYFDGVLFKEGLLKFNKLGDGGISTNFEFGFATLSDNVKEVSLKELMTGTIQLYDKTAYSKRADLTFQLENLEIYIVINGNAYFQNVTNTGDAKTPLVSAINAETAENNCIASEVNGALRLEPATDVNNIETPFNIIGEARAWHADNNYSEFTALVKATVDAYLDEGNEPDDMIRFPMYQNDGDVYSSDEHQTKQVNANTDGAYIMNIAGATSAGALVDLGFDFTAINYNSLCPMVKLSYVLQRIEERFGIQFSGDFLQTNWYSKGLIFNTQYLDVSVPFMGDTPVIFFKDTITLSEHVPDMKVNEFLKALQARFNLTMYYNEATGKVVLNNRNVILGAGYEQDLTGISSTPKPVSITCKTGLTLKSPAYEDDILSVTDQKKIGTNIDDELITQCRHISQYKESYSSSSGKLYEVPVVNQKPNTKWLHLIFDHYGKQTVYGGNTFYTGAIEELTQGYFFESIYDSTWDQYVRFLLERKEVEASMLLELRHLLSIDFEKKYRVAGVDYLLKSIDINLTMTGIAPAKVVMFST